MDQGRREGPGGESQRQRKPGGEKKGRRPGQPGRTQQEEPAGEAGVARKSGLFDAGGSQPLGVTMIMCTS